MNIYRILVSFVAGTIVVLAMLLTGLKLFSGRPAAPAAVADGFTVEHLTPEQASRLLDRSEQGNSANRQQAEDGAPGSLQHERN